MPIYIPSLNIAGVKNVNVHPYNKDLPSVMATITLFDPENGFPVAIMDGTYITKMRTGAAGGVAAKYLSRQDSRVAACIGTGVQAKTQLDALMVVRPDISNVIAFDTNSEQANHFARYVEDKYSVNVECAETVEQAVKNADIVTTTTPVRKPIIQAQYIRKGTHINAIGADAQGKQELDAEILKNARVVVDNVEQASHGGEINVAISKGIIKTEDLYGDIGEIVSGKKIARDTSDLITVFDSTGLAIQDIYSAYEIYRKIISDDVSIAELDEISFLD